MRCNTYIKSLKLGKNLEKISIIKLFTDKYNWERINYSSEKEYFLKKNEKIQKRKTSSCLRFKT